MNGHFLAVGPRDIGLHRLGILRAEIEDMPHLDAARGNLPLGRNGAERCASCISSVAA